MNVQAATWSGSQEPSALHEVRPLADTTARWRPARDQGQHKATALCESTLHPNHRCLRGTAARPGFWGSGFFRLGFTGDGCWDLVSLGYGFCHRVFWAPQFGIGFFGDGCLGPGIGFLWYKNPIFRLGSPSRKNPLQKSPPAKNPLQKTLRLRSVPEKPSPKILPCKKPSPENPPPPVGAGENQLQKSPLKKFRVWKIILFWVGAGKKKPLRKSDPQLPQRIRLGSGKETIPTKRAPVLAPKLRNGVNSSGVRCCCSVHDQYRQYFL